MSELEYTWTRDRYRNEEHDITIRQMSCCNRWIIRHGPVKHQEYTLEAARAWAQESVDSQRPSVTSGPLPL